MKLYFNCGKPQVKTFWFYCLSFITPKIHQVPPRDMYIAFFLSRSPSQVGYCFSKARTDFDAIPVYISLVYSFSSLRVLLIFAHLHYTSSTLRINQLYFISGFCLFSLLVSSNYNFYCLFLQKSLVLCIIIQKHYILKCF